MQIVLSMVGGVDFGRCIVRDMGILWSCLGVLDVLYL